MRQISAIDRLCDQIQQGLQAAHASAIGREQRPSPAANLDNIALNESEQNLSASLMRVNHSGEVAAQGLYHGQALTADRPDIEAQMAEAAAEETDHLSWCEGRLKELEARPSLFTPLFYWGSVGIGAIAGKLGDGVSLGFVSATEEQVSAHLDRHLEKLPSKDMASRVILQQMRQDEMQHAVQAKEAGGKELPKFVTKGLMPLLSGAMIQISRRI